MLILKLLEKISLKLSILTIRGIQDRLLEVSIFDFDLGNTIPMLNDVRYVPSDNPYNKAKENYDLV